MDVASFYEFIHSRKKINTLVICGNQLAIESGLYTYLVGDGPSWRNYSPIDLATLDGFDANPEIVWLFYTFRRHSALISNPNEGHRVVSMLTKSRIKFNTLVITQNTDNLLQRVGIDEQKLLEFNGSIFRMRCNNFLCNYECANFDDPINVTLDATTFSNNDTPLPKITDIDQLPICPKCLNRFETKEILRPGVLWFGEYLPVNLLDKADEFVMENDVDLLILVGTPLQSGYVTSYIDLVNLNKGSIAIFNPQYDDDIQKMAPQTKIWQFVGQCSETLPEVFDPVFNDEERFI